MKILSIIIPVFNEEKFITEVLKKTAAANSLNYKKEIIIVNDGSTDDTSKQIRETTKILSKKYPSVTFKELSLKINSGKSAAVKNGMLQSKGEVVLIQDADLEYSPDDYPLILEPFSQNMADVVYGSRFISSRPHRVLYFWHYVINVFLTGLSNMLTNLNLTDMETGYKALKGDLARKIAVDLESQRFGFEPEVTARISKIKNVRVYEVGISYSGRTYEEGKKIYWLDGIKAVWQIIKYNLLS
jgi:glycosyltransferase involved in cell wall biosynthesis